MRSVPCRHGPSSSPRSRSSWARGLARSRTTSWWIRGSRTERSRGFRCPPWRAMQGRFHRYEGYSVQQIAFPVRVLQRLGARTLLVSNACGGMQPLWSPGDLMLIADHINLLGDNPLVGPNDDALGPRFPDMSEPYDAGLRALARQVALERGITLREGVYVAVTGPNLETRAEYRMLRALGADVVGMSTVPEVIAAVHMGLKVLGVSIITDQCLPDALAPTSVEQIIAVARAAEPGL